MYHQFKELADVDITAEPMEIGPTCHYVMGGVEVDADTEESAVTGLYAAGEVRRRHARLQPARRQLARPTCWCSAGGPARRRRRTPPALGDQRPAVADAARSRRRSGARRWRRSSVEGGENPYTIQHDLQESMNDLVGIIRTAERARASRSAAIESAQGAGHDS